MFVPTVQKAGRWGENWKLCNNYCNLEYFNLKEILHVTALFALSIYFSYVITERLGSPIAAIPSYPGNKKQWQGNRHEIPSPVSLKTFLSPFPYQLSPWPAWLSQAQLLPHCPSTHMLEHEEQNLQDNKLYINCYNTEKKDSVVIADTSLKTIRSVLNSSQKGK